MPRPALGATFTPTGVSFRVWAPDHAQASVVVESGAAVGEYPLHHESDGFYTGHVSNVTAGDRYRFRPGTGQAFPDPASRYQPDGPHGPSEVIDPHAFAWADGDWKGVNREGVVFYEMHVGTFTREGTYEAAIAQLPALAEVGVTCLELMPVNEFPGRFGWGYDGVNLFATHRHYGRPDDLRRFVDAAHKLGLGVILDVVYNHLGPDGNYLGQFATHYFTDRHRTEWGRAINFDDDQSGPVREFFLANAAYWISEFHFDGLRIDATQNIYDDKPPPEHILAEIGRVTRAAAGKRHILLVNENESQHSDLSRPVERGGYGLDMIWNDDVHHSLMVALTGRREAYYVDYLGTPQELLSAAKYGFLYVGQHYVWHDRRRGRPGFDLAPACYVSFFQNHDQVANSGRGLRAHQQSSPGRYRAAQAYTLLIPSTPLLFQGQEWSASSPFLYFADHAHDSLGPLVQAGRLEFLTQFRNLADEKMKGVFAVPFDPATFERSKLDHGERTRGPHAEAFKLTKDLLTLRREDPAFRAQVRRGIGGAVLGPQAFVIRWFQEDGLDRLLVVNFGPDLHLSPCPEPLLAPPTGCRWAVALSTEDPAYGGCGTENPDTDTEGWRIMGEAAVALVPEPLGGGSPQPVVGRRRIVY